MNKFPDTWPKEQWPEHQKETKKQLVQASMFWHLLPLLIVFASLILQAFASSSYCFCITDPRSEEKGYVELSFCLTNLLMITLQARTCSSWPCSERGTNKLDRPKRCGKSVPSKTAAEKQNKQTKNCKSNPEKKTSKAYLHKSIVWQLVKADWGNKENKLDTKRIKSKTVPETKQRMKSTKKKKSKKEYKKQKWTNSSHIQRLENNPRIWKDASLEKEV